MTKRIFISTIIILGVVMAKVEMPGFEYIRSSGGINEYKMTVNDLNILLMEDHSAPVATFMVTYRVGSRNEAVGHTGSTHLLEHLMFKGSKNFNKELGTPIWTVLQDVGAMINATTWLDRTNYFELIPIEHLEKAMKIEADRMRDAFLRDADRQPEMTVVRNEFERGENDPFEALDKNIWATAYQAHPYHHSTIGWRSDIENVSTERLKEFYDTFYWPNNATVTVIGDFSEENCLKMIKANFGVLPKSMHNIPQVYTTEPEQEGARRFVIKRSGETPIIGIAHKTPEGLHKDTYAIQVLSRILGSGKTSRYYKSLVDNGLASNIFIWDNPFRDNALFVTYAFLTEGTSPEDVEKIVLGEYERIKKEGVQQDEVDRAIAMISSETAFSRDGSYSVASQLNEAIAVGDWTFYTTFLDRIKEVTVEDVQSAVKEYLQEDRSTTGYFIPISEGGNSEGETMQGKPLYFRENSPEEGFLAVETQGSSGGKVGQLSKNIIDGEVVDGIRLLSLQTPIQDVVTIYGSLLGGDVFSPNGNTMVADITADMLDEGTQMRSKFEISEALESVGAQISFRSTSYNIGFNARCLKKDVPLVIELLAEQLKYPAFNESDLETAKKRTVADLRRSKEETFSRAIEKFSQLIYPENHPNYIPSVDEQIQHTQSLTVDHLKEHHKRLGLGNMILVSAGDVDRKTLEEAITKGFSGWRQSSFNKSDVGGMKANDKDESSEVVFMKDKTSVDLIIGQPIGIDRNHDDFLPLFIGQYILGGNFSARLMGNVRDKEGLTYGIRSGLSGVEHGNDGYWTISGTFAPQNLSKGEESTLRQLSQWLEDGVTKEELEAKKSTITGTYQVGLATTRGLASNILTIAERGWNLSYLDEYPEKINAITHKQVNKAIKKYTTIKKLITVKAGTVQTE